MSSCLPVYQYICVCVCVPVCVPTCRSVSAYLCVYLSVCLCVCLSVYLSTGRRLMKHKYMHVQSNLLLSMHSMSICSFHLNLISILSEYIHPPLKIYTILVRSNLSLSMHSSVCLFISFDLHNPNSSRKLSFLSI